MDTIKFFCSRVERGASQCGEQCEQCGKRVNGDHVVDEVQAQAAADMEKQSEANAAEAIAAATAAAQEGPQVVAQITVTLWNNGDFRVDGPMHDRVMVRGMLSLALDQEGNMFRDAMTRARLQAEQRAKEPRWKRALRDKLASIRGKKEAAKNAAAQAEADRRKDELQKELERNAQSGPKH